MRMWMIYPGLMCTKHILGEHNELHKFIPSFEKGYKVDKRFSPIVQIQFIAYRFRHDQLVEEMLKREINHKSPLPKLPDFKKLYPKYFNKIVNIQYNKTDLCSRCDSCKQLFIDNPDMCIRCGANIKGLYCNVCGEKLSILYLRR